MKKLFCAILLILPLLCSCKNSKENEITTETISTSESDIETTTSADNSEHSVSYYTNFYEYVLDENTGQSKYGRFLGEPITYRGEDTNLVVSLNMNTGNSECKDISMMCIMLLDGQLIPFSINGEDKQLVNYIIHKNNTEVKYHLDFIPYGISTTEEKELYFVAIPFYLNNKLEIEDNYILYNSHHIISESEDLSREEYKDGAWHFTNDVESVYGKPIWEICEYYDNGSIYDYIIQKDDGEINYLANYDDGEFVTFLFCDGKLFNGFDGEYYLKWRVEQSYLNKEIDVSSLDKGNHLLYVVTVDITRDHDFFAIQKSMNKEVIIYE